MATLGTTTILGDLTVTGTLKAEGANSQSGDFLPTTGGTMTGDLIIQSASPTTLSLLPIDNIKNEGAQIVFGSTDNQHIRLRANHYDSVRAPFGFHIEKCSPNAQTGKAYLEVEGEIFANGGSKVYHEGNKPTPADIGCVSNLKDGSATLSLVGGKILETSTPGNYSISMGYNSQATGSCAVAMGSNCKATSYGTATGYTSQANGSYSVAMGTNAVASGSGAFASSVSTASGTYSHAINGGKASGWSSHAEGSGTASGNNSHAGGEGTTAETYALRSIGHYNKANTGSTNTFSSTLNAFVIGNGTSQYNRSNAFRVNFSGQTYGLSAFNSTGADYAEYFEWKDGNPENEDRIGLFVALDGEKIKLATSEDDYIVGIISGNQSIIGNACEDGWNEMYIRDAFGRLQYEDVEIERERGHINKDTNEIETVTEKVIEKHIKLNPNYDSNIEYTPRSERKEWGIVGMLGQIVVKDDGTCNVNGYCKPSKNGIATHSDDKAHYRVMSRISNNLIKVIMK